MVLRTVRGLTRHDAITKRTRSVGTVPAIYLPTGQPTSQFVLSVRSQSTTTMTSTPSDQRTATPLTTDGVESESFVSAPETQSPRPVAAAPARGRGGDQFPNHPIPHLQGPFEESIVEADEEGGDRWVVEVDAQGRRRDLLEKGGYERLCGRKWRQRPGER